jgi:recombination protein RecT
MATTLATAVNGNGQKTPPELAAKIQMIRALTGEIDNAIPPAVKKVLTPDRMCRLVLTAMRQVRNLDQCTFPSLAGALMVAAQLGLEPCTPLGHCYIIPRRNGKTGQYEATFQLGYQGMLELAYRTETIKSVTAKAVHANDEFLYEEGLDDRLVHRPYLGGPRGDVVAYYAVIKFINGGHAFDVMSFAEMANHVERFAPRDYKTQQITGPWATDFDEMSKKTMIRRLFKMMRKSTDIVAKATLYDERVIDRDQATTELRPQFEPPAPLPQPLPQPATEPVFQDIEEEPADEPHTEPEPPVVKATKAAPKKKATLKAEESKASPLAQTVSEIEDWFKAVTAKNDEGGMSEIANRDVLMDWLWSKLVADGKVSADVTHWYGRLNALAKMGGDANATLAILDEALESVRKDYLGEPDASNGPEQSEDPKQPTRPEKSGETSADKQAAIERWFEDAATSMGERGHRSLVMPSALVAAVHKLAQAAGLIPGTANGYRTRLIEISEIPGTAHDVIQQVKPFCKQLMAELEAPEPGSDG